MALTVRQIAKGPRLGDALDELRGHRQAVIGAFVAMAAAFVVVALFAPLVGLLLLAFLLMAGVAVGLYSRRQVRGHGRLSHHRRQRR